MDKKKLSDAEMSRLFEYSPGEPPYDEVMDAMARMGTKPESVKDPKERAQYIKFLETFDADAE